MPLKLMYITNNPEVATIVEHAGVDRIFIDMEFIGKDARQGGLDTDLWTTIIRIYLKVFSKLGV